MHTSSPIPSPGAHLAQPFASYQFQLSLKVTLFAFAEAQAPAAALHIPVFLKISKRNDIFPQIFHKKKLLRSEPVTQDSHRDCGLASSFHF